MATDNQEYEITYGTLTVGGTTDYLLRGSPKLTETTDKASVEFEFFYQHQTLASFQTLDDTVRAALLKARQNFTWKISSTTHRTYSHTGNTGFNSEPQIIKDEDPLNTGRSRLIRVRIEFTLPFTGSAVGGEDDAGRKSWSGEIDADAAGIRIFRVTGTYTATAALGSARTVYSAKVGALAAGWLTDLGVTAYNFIRETVIQDDQNKEVSFTREYRDIIASEAGSSNDTDITEQNLQIERQKTKPPRDAQAGVSRIVNLTVRYEATIHKSNTALQTKWDGIRSWIVTSVVPAYQAGAVALLDESVAFLPDTNRISATMVFEVITAGIVLESRLKVRWRYDNGERLADIHGKVLDKRKYVGPGKLTMMIEKYWKRLTQGGGAAAKAGGIDVRDPGADVTSTPIPGIGTIFRGVSADSMIETPLAHEWQPYFEGIDDKQLPAEEVTDVIEREYYNENVSSGGGAPNVTNTGPAGFYSGR